MLPERVTLALAELAGAAREACSPSPWGPAWGYWGSLLDADVERLVGAKGRHNPDRAAVPHGTQPGKVTLGGRRIRVDRLRVRSADGTAELPMPTCRAFASTELLDQLALERMLAKLSTRRYHHGLEPVGSRVEQASSGPPGRRSRAGSSPPPSMPWPSCWPPTCLAADLSGLDLVALLIDGIRVAEHTCVVALGITLNGTKVPLALASVVAKRLRAAYRNPDPLVPQPELEALARELGRSHPGAAASLRERLAETLTIGRLGVPPTLAQTLRSTNAIESMIEICRDHAANVKRWRDGR